jgi:hypothetical protein
VLEKKLDPAQGNRRRCSGDLLLVGEVQKILAQVFLAELIWAPMMVRGQLTHGRDVALLSSCRKPSKLHILDHPLP